MHRKPIIHLALQVAACGICLKTVDLDSDCWRTDRTTGGLSHLLCIAVVMTDAEDAPQLSTAELAEAVNEAAAELCSTLCENPGHPSTATACRYDVEMLGAVGCSPDQPEAWAADHFHAVLGGSPCSCRHESAPEANAANGVMGV